MEDEKLNGLALALRAYAEKKGREEGRPYWKVLRAKAIVSICNHAPMTVKDLDTKGLLPESVQKTKYGADIVNIVREHLADENAPLALVEKERNRRTEEKSEKRTIVAKKNGFYYGVSGNDALLLHKYLGYKLYGADVPHTGFPAKAAKTVLEKLDRLRMDYILLDKAENTVVHRQFEPNLYETVTDLDASPSAAWGMRSSIVPRATKRAPTE